MSLSGISSALNNPRWGFPVTARGNDDVFLFYPLSLRRRSSEHALTPFCPCRAFSPQGGHGTTLRALSFFSRFSFLARVISMFCAFLPSVALVFFSSAGHLNTLRGFPGISLSFPFRARGTWAQNRPFLYLTLLTYFTNIGLQYLRGSPCGISIQFVVVTPQ